MYFLVFRLVLEFDIIVFAFARFPIVLWVWLCMKLSTTLLVFPGFYFWSNTRRQGPACKQKQQHVHVQQQIFRTRHCITTGVFTDFFDWLMLGVYVCYQLVFLYWPVSQINSNDLPPASAVIVACEQVSAVSKTSS